VTSKNYQVLAAMPGPAGRDPGENGAPGSNLTAKHGSATSLLDREVPEESLRESTAQVAAKKNLVEHGTRSVVIFRIATEWLALPTEAVQEVGDPGAVRRLPDHRGGILKGLVNVRGDLLICIALDVILGLDPAAVGQGAANSVAARRLMICKRGSAKLSFQVDEVHGLHRYHPRDLRSAPATLAKAEKGVYTLGVLSWNNKIVGCLDDELLFYSLNKGLA
jgi:chemotaxis-related protein WspD